QLQMNTKVAFLVRLDALLGAGETSRHRASRRTVPQQATHAGTQVAVLTRRAPARLPIDSAHQEHLAVIAVSAVRLDDEALCSFVLPCRTRDMAQEPPRRGFQAGHQSHGIFSSRSMACF